MVDFYPGDMELKMRYRKDHVEQDQTQIKVISEENKKASELGILKRVVGHSLAKWFDSPKKKPGKTFESRQQLPIDSKKIT